MNKQIRAGRFLWLAIAALLGIALEVILVLGIEEPVFGVRMREWSVLQNLMHWTVTCILWGIVGAYIVKVAKEKYGFDIFEKGKPVKKWQYGSIAICVILMLVLSYIDFHGCKVIKEYVNNGMPRFLFQYIYYVFEVMLCVLAIVFSQKACELWLGHGQIPYGGIFLALTWGLFHISQQGLYSGLITMFGAVVYGILYLLVNKDLKKAYLITLIVFIL